MFSSLLFILIFIFIFIKNNKKNLSDNDSIKELRKTLQDFKETTEKNSSPIEIDYEIPQRSEDIIYLNGKPINPKLMHNQQSVKKPNALTVIIAILIIIAALMLVVYALTSQSNLLYT